MKTFNEGKVTLSSQTPKLCCDCSCSIHDPFPVCFNTDGPYGLQVNADKGLKVGEVFTVDLGEAVLFDCSADSYPPNTYSWIRRSDNTTYVIKHGPHLEVASEKVAQKTTDYMCCAYNNITGRRDEAHFTVIITSVGKRAMGQSVEVS